jgi:cytochrome P450
MSGKATRKPFNENDYSTAGDEHAKNRVIFEWICDDHDRAMLYQNLSNLQIDDLGNKNGAKPFPVKSRAKFLDDPAPMKSDSNDDRGSTVYLVHNRKDINAIMLDTECFSNLPYLEIGSGGFMLGLDPLSAPSSHGNVDVHKLQRDALEESLRSWKPAEIKTLSELAVQEAKVMALRNKNFDLADFSEQAALRFCIKLFGFATSDYGLLEESLRRAYRGMNYQMFGRHFLSEPLTLPLAKEWMGRLGTRVSQLLDDYQRLPNYPRWDKRIGDPREQQRTLPEGVEPLSDFGLTGTKPVLQALATSTDSNLTGQERMVVAVGTLAGIVGNIQASVCIAVEHILTQRKDKKIQKPDDWTWIAEAMKLNPPAPYLPRIVAKDVTTPSGLTLRKGEEVILMIGTGTNDSVSNCPFHNVKGQQEDSLIFGFGENVNHARQAYSQHWCVGDYLARPLIEETVRTTLALPGLSRRYDPVTAVPLHLEKRWGFACEKFPLSYKREKLRTQQSLNVVMRIKAPIQENAERLKRVIVGGAPRIESALIKARHVHFAWFEFIENDTKLVLHTVYDGDFEAYVSHFALTVDDMFDQLFMSIEGAPPLPVRDFPYEFVETLRRFNLPPAAGYLFSAYPTAETHKITAAVEGGTL